jgi:hypothetical protein
LQEAFCRVRSALGGNWSIVKEAFREYYPLTGDELAVVLRDATIALDTNALLDLYRMAEQAADELLRVLEAARAQPWLPHQVGFEYHELVDQETAKLLTEHAEARNLVSNVRKAQEGTRSKHTAELQSEMLDAVSKVVEAELEKEKWQTAALKSRFENIRSKIEDLYLADTEVVKWFDTSRV